MQSCVFVTIGWMCMCYMSMTGSALKWGEGHSRGLPFLLTSQRKNEPTDRPTDRTLNT